METLPEEDEWYCPLCKNDGSSVIKAGQKLKESSKKAKMASAKSKSTRDWGKGMACVGRTKVCTIVPPNHFGPIPGVPVGSCWKYRVQVSYPNLIVDFLILDTFLEDCVYFVFCHFLG